ncbi:mannose-1-phosphate guanylyltransferase [Clostridium frigidicarnis]|uniref:mannose-1-phosphate guanylyltransferase n=1 Tax=Clostridium frigidicarnis TaxID=84698 RepID=A0A1I0WJ52_9CLOT|nr:mannose-1-phosphate guanylyltransferase [Clostridium frigidicarnis]SFA88651.1 mannose-1-phosphate guanylyltransferase (GDP) [Clostridium frigidicarnis]
MLCALIMAGGKGTRFWPLSTENKPKQFLSLLGEETMIQMTVNRIHRVIPYERIFIVTCEEYKKYIQEQLPYIPEENIILEPMGRNTAPCIALSAFEINKKFKNSSMVVLPADHLVRDEERFVSIIRESYGFVDNNPKSIVTIGIKPTRPETGYGYIEYDAKSLNGGLKKVSRFVEKPNIDKAMEYLKNGNFLWNSGIFLWNSNYILELMRQYLKDTYNLLKDVYDGPMEKYDENLKKAYEKAENISVDYAIMEKINNIYVIDGELGWDDVGSWKAISRYNLKDLRENIKMGKVKLINSKNNMVVSSNKKIILADVEDLIVVESDDMIMITKMDNIDKVSSYKDKVQEE